jgi:hypothetical protein
MGAPATPRRTKSRRESSGDLPGRIAGLDWGGVAARLAKDGCARAGTLLTPRECSQLVDCYDDDGLFRSRIVMQQHAFGIGDYAYFAAPLPPLVSELREFLYERLFPIANEWASALRRRERYPPKLSAYLARCHRAGQTRPTPLLLHYEADGFNRLHRDLYGELRFPLQAMLMLSRPGVDFTGGEFLLVENRPRQQALGRALAPQQGELVVFAVDERPVQGKRSTLRASLRHGVSEIEAGRRFTLGIIFHDAA